jgi:aryl-alcohol dehydrogenase-like predicted oxidoreductase
MKRSIGPFTVHPIGLGCMNLSHAYGTPPSPAVAEAVLRAALEAGVEHFDTAALYGFGANEELVGRVLEPHRHRVLLASKGGMAGATVDGVMKRVIDGTPHAIRRNCEDSLKRLRTDHIDLYYLHRWDKLVPIEESAAALGALVREGKVRAIGLSEVSAATLRAAHAVHPIAAVQSEYSLWTRNAEIAVLDACRELGVAFVAFSPLARAFLADAMPDPATLDAKDIRRTMPRFDAEHYPKNRRLLDGWRALAREAGCTPAQLALSWLLSHGDFVHAIPGTTNPAHVLENIAAASLALRSDLLERAGALINSRTVSGVRYGPQASAEVDTEDFAAQ